MMPSSSDLTYFIEVASSLNLSRAAERLGLSQPSLTLAIQRLENSMGTPLLLRSKKGVTLTQAGRQLMSHARELLQQWDTLKSQTLASTRNIQGSYSIGCHPSVALYSLDLFLPGLLEKYPDLEIKLNHNLSRKIAESVVRMETDIGIVVNPVRHPDLVIRKLCEDQVTFWVGDGKRKTQDLSSGEAVMICDPELLQTQALMKKIKKSGFKFRRVLHSSNLEVITKLVVSGAGVGILPGRVATAVATSGIRKVPKAPFILDEISLLYRMENKSVCSIQAIAESIVSAFKLS